MQDGADPLGHDEDRAVPGLIPERAAQVVCDAILENYPKVQSVTVELKKPEAPINAVFDYVSVEMTRSRA